jgi:hypothetical protein
METLKNWAKSKPILAVAAILIVATIVYSLFFGSPDVPV